MYLPGCFRPTLQCDPRLGSRRPSHSSLVILTRFVCFLDLADSCHFSISISMATLQSSLPRRPISCSSPVCPSCRVGLPTRATLRGRFFRRRSWPQLEVVEVPTWIILIPESSSNRGSSPDLLDTLRRLQSSNFPERRATRLLSSSAFFAGSLLSTVTT